MEAVVRCDEQPFRHSDFSKSEQFGEIKEENSENSSEIMTHTSKSSVSSSDDHLEPLPIINPKSPQTKPPKPQEMSSDDDEDYRLSGQLFELPDILTLSSFSFSRVPAISSPSFQTPRRSGSKSPPADWSIVSSESFFSLPMGSRSFSRDYNKSIDMKSPEHDNILREFEFGHSPVFVNSNKKGPGKNVRVQWNDPDTKTYTFAVEEPVARQPSAIEPEGKSSSSSSSSESSCSSCSSWWRTRPNCSCSCNLMLCRCSISAFSCF